MKILEIKNYIKIILVSAGLGAVAADISSNSQQEHIPLRIETIRATCRNGQILPDYQIIEFFRAQGINVRQNMQIEIKYPTNCIVQREERELPRRRFPTKIRRENPTPFGTLPNSTHDGSGWASEQIPRVRLSRERVKIRLR